MNFILLNLSTQYLSELEKTVLDTVDVLESFDFSVFKNMDKKISINDINVICSDNNIQLNKKINIEYPIYMDNRSSYNRGTEYKLIEMNVDFNIFLYNEKVNYIELTTSQQYHDGYRPTLMFSMNIGDKKCLISNTHWYNKNELEAIAFQKNTVDKPVPFDIQFVNKIYNKVSKF